MPLACLCSHHASYVFPLLPKACCFFWPFLINSMMSGFSLCLHQCASHVHTLHIQTPPITSHSCFVTHTGMMWSCPSWWMLMMHPCDTEWLPLHEWCHQVHQQRWWCHQHTLPQLCVLCLASHECGRFAWQSLFVWASATVAQWQGQREEAQVDIPDPHLFLCWMALTLTVTQSHAVWSPLLCSSAFPTQSHHNKMPFFKESWSNEKRWMVMVRTHQKSEERLWSHGRAFVFSSICCHAVGVIVWREMSTWTDERLSCE